MSSNLTERCSFLHSRSWLSKTRIQHTERAVSRALCIAPFSVTVEVGSQANQLKRTYSKSAACLLMPIGGGAIQLAYLPVSTTRPINEAT